jgi:hypothetical protein
VVSLAAALPDNNGDPDAVRRPSRRKRYKTFDLASIAGAERLDVLMGCWATATVADLSATPPGGRSQPHDRRHIDERS